LGIVGSKFQLATAAPLVCCGVKRDSHLRAERQYLNITTSLVPGAPLEPLTFADEAIK
jgi:hypothetical protein